MGVPSVVDILLGRHIPKLIVVLSVLHVERSVERRFAGHGREGRRRGEKSEEEGGLSEL